MSQRTLFKLDGIYSFSRQKTEVERLKEKLPRIEKVELGKDKVVTFVHDPTTTAAEIRKALEDMNLHPTDNRIIRNDDGWIGHLMGGATVLDMK
ncbi:hypothetical protein SUGI_0733070 [Cryptomeria japonica]|nr:hypothetical protein SUGI_0733070 [Cryptomeria japonica]